MKMNYRLSTLAYPLALLLMAGCASESTNQEQSSGAIRGVTFTSMEPTGMTRTSITGHTVNGGAKVLWSTGDKIWVKDDGGTFHESAAGVLNSAKTHGTFTLSGTYTQEHHDVTYTGGASATQVTIASSQSQSAPNNTDHIAASGDCGTATADKSGSDYVFKLDHQSAYLCFVPRCENAELGANIYLTKIVVTSNDDIAGTYTLSAAGLTLAGGGSRTITLTLPNFPLTNTTTDLATNASYMVIAPGQHTLAIDYYIKDPTTGVEGAVTKNITLDFVAGSVTDLTAKIDVMKNYTNKFYTWDASTGQDYWAGHTSDQPKVNGGFDANFPSNPADSRWYNTTPYPVTASHTCAGSPSVNGIRWLVEQGDSHYDATTLWSMMGHLYNRGVWFKSPASYSDAVAPNGKDYRYNGEDANIGKAYDHIGRPADAVIANYFYLPILGWYENGKLIDPGVRTGYWTSSARPETWQQYAYVLYLTNANYMDVSAPYWKRDFGLKPLSRSEIQ